LASFKDYENLILELYEMNIMNIRFIRVLLNIAEESVGFDQVAKSFINIVKNEKIVLKRFIENQKDLLSEINSPDFIQNEKKNEELRLSISILEKYQTEKGQEVLKSAITQYHSMIENQLLNISTNFTESEDSLIYKHGDLNSFVWKDHLINF